MSKHVWFTAIAATISVGSALGFTYDGSNWVRNGGGEATAVGNMNKTIDPNFGWDSGSWHNNGCTNTTVEVKSYASIWDMADPNNVPDGWGYMGPSAASRGNNVIVGGPVTGGSGWWITGLYEDNWLWSDNTAIAKIDAGNLQYDLSAWLGGFTTGPWAPSQSGAFMSVNFSGTYNGVVTVSLPQVNTPANPSGGFWSGMTFEEKTGIIPVGTRRIEVYLNFIHWGPGWDGAGNHTDPLYNYGMADNVTFAVGKPVPEPATMIALGVGVLGILARRRKKS